MRLLDLIPSAPMVGRSFSYVQEGGSFDTARELATKPESGVDLPQAEVVAKTIAHWIKVPKREPEGHPQAGRDRRRRVLGE